MNVRAFFLAGACAALATPCAAQERAITFDTFASTDADHTQVVRSGVNLDWSHRAEDRYQGIRLEKAWFKPLGGATTGFERAYLRYADRGGAASWSAQLGTDGHTVLGSANAALGSRWRKEAFIERDVLETPRGVGDGIYYTFAGAALDVPLGERDSATLVAGAQAFTGRNVRLHLRGNYVHLVKPDWGLTAQLRTRWFHSTVPGESDYFSPRWYAEVLPVLQVRRRVGGWRLLGAAGFGAQRNAGAPWRTARYLNLQASSPADRPLQLKASLLYSNTPVGNGSVYDYLQGSLSLTRRF